MLVQAEESLAVSEHGWKEQPQLAAQYLREFLEAEGFTVRVVSSEFTGYDSSNPTHACAYYLVTLDVPEEALEILLLDLE